jgi:hypothetical protein
MDDARAAKLFGEDTDADGHYVTFDMSPMRGDKLMDLTVRRGIDPGVAATILRKLADRIDQYGGKLLNLQGGGHWFTSDGEIDIDVLQDLE